MSLAITIVLSCVALFGIWRLSKAMDRRNAKSMRESDEMWAKALKEIADQEDRRG